LELIAARFLVELSYEKRTAFVKGMMRLGS
jgi:hypothetical protein